MDAKTRFLELKRAWKEAPESERQRIGQETDSFLSSLSEEEKKQVFAAIDEDFREIHKEAADIKELLDIRAKLDPVLPAISVSYLAKHYFKKTPQWFYQRMNGNLINGKPAKFTEAEINILNFAIQDIGKKLRAVSI